MRKILSFFITVLLFGCSDSKIDEDQFIVSEVSFPEIDCEASELSVDMVCDKNWTASSNVSWCNITPSTGTGSNSISINIQSNDNFSSRSAVIEIRSNNESKFINISQSGLNEETYVYNINLIFHVLYKDKNEPLQHVSSNRLKDVVAKLNSIYQKSGNYNKMKINFQLATKDPSGNNLEEPGVEYIRWEKDYPLDCYEFMTNRSNKYTNLIWNPEKYINIMLYPFKDNKEGKSTILGLSHMPLSKKGAWELEGLEKINNLSFACKILEKN